MAGEISIKNWQILNDLLTSELTKNIFDFVNLERQTKTIFPKPKDVFKAFELCSFANTKVIILGQDPYHNENQAIGLSFAVNNDCPIPPSLRNIIGEIKRDLGVEIKNTDLKYLAKQGVLLLNSVLTVEKNNPNSHAKCGWEDFSDEVIMLLSENKTNLVFLLWGEYAKQKQNLIDTNKHLVLTTSHPSPFSAHRGFNGCGHFSQANKYLQANKLCVIEY